MPTTQRREATKARLVKAAVSEFAIRGIDATSVEQLCEAAGFTRGAFYSNFETKDDLCIEVTRAISATTNDALQATLSDMPTEVEQDDMVRYLFAMQAPSDEVRTTQMELELRAHRDPEFGTRYRQVRAELLPSYDLLVQEAANRADVELLIPARDLLFIYEAIYFYPGGDGEAERTPRLMTLLSKHLSRPVER